MKIGNNPYIIAELSGNHDGDIEKAVKLIAAACLAGCDAVKIQTYEPDDLHDPKNNAIYERCKIPREWHERLFKVARELGIPLFSSVFAPWAIEHLEKFNCPAYKIASPESTRLRPNEYGDLAKAIRKTGKTFLASSGKRDMPLIEPLHPDILFYCKQGYPAQITDDDLEYVSEMRQWEAAGWIGFSDHTTDMKSPMAMIGCGAQVIEKHFKLDEQCVDAAFSFNPQQMALLCKIAHR